MAPAPFSRSLPDGGNYFSVFAMPPMYENISPCFRAYMIRALINILSRTAGVARFIAREV